MIEVTALVPPTSFARVDESHRLPLRVGMVQHRWQADAAALRAELGEGITRAAGHGAAIVFLPELTLSRYPAVTLPTSAPGATAEDLTTGPTFAFAAEAAQENGVHVHASLYEKADAGDGLGFNTAIMVSPPGSSSAEPGNCTSRSPRATTRTGISAAATTRSPTRSTASRTSTASGWACPPAGMSGFPK